MLLCNPPIRSRMSVPSGKPPVTPSCHPQVRSADLVKRARETLAELEAELAKQQADPGDDLPTGHFRKAPDGCRNSYDQLTGAHDEPGGEDDDGLRGELSKLCSTLDALLKVRTLHRDLLSHFEFRPGADHQPFEVALRLQNVLEEEVYTAHQPGLTSAAPLQRALHSILDLKAELHKRQRMRSHATTALEQNLDMFTTWYNNIQRDYDKSWDKLDPGLHGEIEVLCRRLDLFRHVSRTASAQALNPPLD